MESGTWSEVRESVKKYLQKEGVVQGTSDILALLHCAIEDTLHPSLEDMLRDYKTLICREGIKEGIK
jgi:hypothetical protein